jgi:hypothetical protein
MNQNGSQVKVKKQTLNGKILLYQPGYAGGHPKSHEAFWVGATAPKSYLNGRIVRSTCYGMSLLANSFNQGWAHALNLRVAFATGQKAKEEGKRRINPYPRYDKTDMLWESWNAGYDGDLTGRVDFFSMLHDDVVPQDDWLTILHAELVRSGADLLSAVVPLKDHKGLTSTAIDDPSQQFVVERRLTMAEVFASPETFSAADCGYPGRLLLANTGCWIVRLDIPFLTLKNEDGSARMRFSIDDRIVWNEDRNSWTAQTMSEDWAFSRDFGNMGGKVLCTRKVKLLHYGSFPFDNKSGDWGMLDHDTATAAKFGGKPINGASIPEKLGGDGAVPEHWSEAFPDVRGWFKDIEGELLADLVKDKEVLEIGSYCGLSTIWALRAAAKVSCVDTFDGRGTPFPEDTFNEFCGNLERWCPDKCTSEHLVIYRNEVAYTLSKLAEKGIKYDLVFIDGAHDRESVERDAEASLKVLKPDGLLAFHDFGSEAHPAVTEVVRGLLDKGAELLAVSGILAVIDPSGMGKKREQGPPVPQVELSDPERPTTLQGAVEADNACLSVLDEEPLDLYAVAGLEGDNVP